MDIKLTNKEDVKALNLSDQFRTPPELFKELDGVFHFFWDACCNSDNCLVPNEQMVGANYDYLTHEWRGGIREYQQKWFPECSIFINPPYSRGSVLPIMKKAWEDAKYFRVVMLLKCDMSTDWANYPYDESSACPLIEMQHTDESIASGCTHLYAQMQAYKFTSGILFLRKRIKFNDSEGIPSKSGAKFPNMIVILDRRFHQ